MNKHFSHAAPVVIIGGGQSGLSAGRAVRDAGLRPVILEASARPAGSWPSYYDSLRLFSPAGFSAMPGMDFPGDPEHYPHRDEVAEYLETYAKTLDVEIRTDCRVESVEPDGRGFAVHTSTGESLSAAAVIAASGSFSNPYLPVLPDQDLFSGSFRHSAGYRHPGPYAGKRVIVVGAGNSAVQIAYELARTASVTLATRRPVSFWEQRPGGRDLHHRLKSTGFDDLPLSWVSDALSVTPVLDSGAYRQALQAGLLDRRAMFTAFTADGVVWPDGSHEPVDAVIFATGYRPSLDYLRPLGALAADGMPLHTGGISTTHPGLAYVGLEFQRSFSSNTLRGAHRDAQYVAAPLDAHIHDAVRAIGL